MDNDPEFGVTLVLVAGYFLIQIAASLTAAKPVHFAFLPSIPFGALLIGVSFTWIDLVNDHLGKARGRMLVLVTVACELLLMLWFQAYIAAPGAAGEPDQQFHQRAIGFVLGQNWRIYAASIVTLLVAENIDISIFHYFKLRQHKFRRWQRSLFSNCMSAPLDATLFPLLAFAGVLSGKDMIFVIAAGCLYKLAIAVVSVPLVWLVSSSPLSKAEIQKLPAQAASSKLMAG